MMCIHMTFSKKTTPLHSTHSTQLFIIFFSLLTLSPAFLQKASGPGKILHYKCPNDINIQFCAPSRPGTKAVIPGILKSSNQRNQTKHDALFAVMGPLLWNIIPGNLHSIDSLLRFKTNLKAFLKTFPDEPPVPSYICRNGNSLLEWNENKAASLLHGRSNSSMTL